MDDGIFPRKCIDANNDLFWGEKTIISGEICKIPVESILKWSA